MSSSETNKPYRCEECGISFKSQQELQAHNNQEHIGTAWKPSCRPQQVLYLSIFMAVLPSRTSVFAKNPLRRYIVLERRPWHLEEKKSVI